MPSCGGATFVLLQSLQDTASVRLNIVKFAGKDKIWRGKVRCRFLLPGPFNPVLSAQAGFPQGLVPVYGSFQRCGKLVYDGLQACKQFLLPLL